MNGLRTRQSLQHLDAAEMERRAALARWSDHEVEAMFEDGQQSATMLGVVIIFVVAVAAGLMLWAMPDIVAWMVGQPTIIVRVQ